MEIKTILFDSIADFVSYTNSQETSKIRLYRGQMEDWPLDSKLLRILKKRNQTKRIYEIEQAIFLNFKKKYLDQIKPSKRISDWEILSIGQHYGLPTRLLDWTSNPLIALWFAFECEKGNNEDRIVWGLVVEKLSLVDFKNDQLFGERFVKIFEPIISDDRVKNQSSWLSVQSFEIFSSTTENLPTFNNYHTLNEDDDFEFYLVKFKFRNSSRIEILDELNEKGIHYNKIYPDIHGLCKSIIWEQLVRNSH